MFDTNYSSLFFMIKLICNTASSAIIQCTLWSWKTAAIKNIHNCAHDKPKWFHKKLTIHLDNEVNRWTNMITEMFTREIITALILLWAILPSRSCFNYILCCWYKHLIVLFDRKRYWQKYITWFKAKHSPTYECQKDLKSNYWLNITIYKNFWVPDKLNYSVIQFKLYHVL